MCRSLLFVSQIFSQVKGIDYSGDEVKIAQQVVWKAVEKSLPEGVGSLDLKNFCTHGTRFYLKTSKNSWCRKRLGKPPKVMVDREEWPLLCKGLVQRGVCCFMELSKAYHVKNQPLLHGLFSVGKNEWDGSLESQRLIMNLVPLNQNSKSLQSDIGTLPALPAMNSFLLEDGETLLLSSEDIRCFFYLLRVPCTWTRFLCFNRRVPDDVLPPELRGRDCVLASRVLPMGWLNSVGIAQHIHRNVVRWSMCGRQPQGGLSRKFGKTNFSPNLFGQLSTDAGLAGGLRGACRGTPRNL